METEKWPKAADFPLLVSYKIFCIAQTELEAYQGLIKVNI